MPKNHTNAPPHSLIRPCPPEEIPVTLGDLIAGLRLLDPDTRVDYTIKAAGVLVEELYYARRNGGAE